MPINLPRILVVGGAGFIGSHMVMVLKEAGFQPVVLDNLSKGHRHAVIDEELIVGDMAESALLESIFTKYQFSAVMHFASFIEVAESVQNPLKYYLNNVAATLNLLDSMLKHEVKHFIFSSTASVYGQPQYSPIDEKHPLNPINPYGRSKLMVEEMLGDIAKNEGFDYAILRYFNAAGSHPLGHLGEQHEPESHLIPLVLQTALGIKPAITVYGHDYETPDHTCIRDYVHVMDICYAHLLALNQLLSGKPSFICNLGTGKGYSVLEVIETVREITRRPIAVIAGERRQGDPAILVADCQLAKRLLAWHPVKSDLKSIVADAWNFLTKRVDAN